MEDTIIRSRIQAMLKTEGVRGYAEAKQWSGHGTDTTCSACNERVTIDQLEVEIELAEPRRSLFFHSKCHSIWRQELRGAVPGVGVAGPVASTPDS